jgi:hypothetical protein
MRGAHEIIDSIHVSIDACSDETYSVNTGGRFSVLEDNLEFIHS